MNISILEINKFILLANLGVEASERSYPQAIEVSIKLHFIEIPTACRSDSIKDAICYADLIAKLESFCAGKEFHLIEYLCYCLHKYLKENILGEHIKLELKICKNPPLEQIKENCCFIISDF